MAKRIGIIGAGAIGSVVGGMLTKAGHDVTLMEQWPEHVEAMKEVGLRLSGTCGEHVVPVKALHLHEMQGLREPFDYVFISVKSYDTEWATAMAVANLRTPGCVITISAGMYEAGHAIRTDTGSIGFKIGEHDGKDTERAQEIARIMNDVAPTKVTTNLWGERWSKLAVNCMVNPISGLSGYDSAEARTADVPRRIAVFTAAEVIQVGRARGYEVEPIYSITAQRFVDATQGQGLAEVEAEMARDAKSRVGGRPSMLQDVMKGRRTEINYLNGYVSDQGKQVGVKTPINDKIVELVNAPGVGLLKPDRKNLDPLWALVPH